MKQVLCVGHAVQDFVFRTPQLPRSAEKYRASGFLTVGGGPAATAAVTIVRLGGVAQLAARIGDDSVAQAIRAELVLLGVDCRYLKNFSGHQSSLSAVFVDDMGERMIVNHTDSSIPVDPAWLLREIVWSGVDAVLADTRWPDGATSVLEAARSRGLHAVLDADVPVPKDGRLLGSASHIAFSLAGLRDFSGCGARASEIEQALIEVAGREQRWCCVTLGGDGVLVVDGRTSLRDASAMPSVSRIPAFRVTPVDTLGAGDVWHGAFALAMAEGNDEISAVRAASAAAAVKVTRPGGRSGAPTRAERDSLLETK